ncbi:hypothetical protein [Streptomyces sp. MAR4 CNX-425]|uniref:hypothetical protein n=1 Tax=Streptomyces sp. MAR4 CNX-425 TaxID=3406343 RepID=UPI003B505FB4
MNLRITAFDDPAATGPGGSRRGRRRGGRDPLRRTADAPGRGPSGRTPPPPRMHRKQTR